MSIWHGTAGGIRLQRIGGARAYNSINPSDVNVVRRRFGFVNDLVSVATGDRVWLRRIEGDGSLSTQPLDMIAGWTAPDYQAYVNVDGVGGIAFYQSWSEALDGLPSNAAPLATPAGAYRVSVDITNANDDRCLAQVLKYTLTTTRQLQDVTAVGAQFKESASTLSGGVGTIDLLWDIGGGWPCEGVDSVEKAHLLHRLALRQQAGASFRGIFLLKREFEQPLDVVLSDRYAQPELFYEADCQIVSAQATVDVNDLLRSSIQFETTGPISLRYVPPFSALLLEQGVSDRLLTEGGEAVALEFLG